MIDDAKLVYVELTMNNNTTYGAKSMKYEIRFSGWIHAKRIQLPAADLIEI